MAEAVDHLTAGPIVLDLTARHLHGPTGRTALAPSEFATLAALMRGGVASPSRLAAAAFPDPARQPADPCHAVRQRIVRLRGALRAVGVSGLALRSYPRHGYSLVFGDAARFRAFAGAELERLTALLASHPDQAAVARLAA